jgi:putative aminopeptidase FrvX
MRRRGFSLFMTVLVWSLTAPLTRAGDDHMIDLLRALADAHGPSGFEEPVRKIMVEQMQPLAERIAYDGLGSVIAVQEGVGPKVMVDAHMGKLGDLIRSITPDGFLTMQLLGGWLLQKLDAATVQSLRDFKPE